MSLQARSPLGIPSTDHWHQLWQTIEQTDLLLSQQEDLSPNNNIVNQVLGNLVDSLCRFAGLPLPKNKIPAHIKPLTQKLPSICARAECEMEKWWARNWLREGKPLANALQEFWYTNQYRALVDAEYQLTANLPLQKICFLGCGALPLTAVLLALKLPESRVVCVDQDPEASQLALKLIAQWRLDNRLTVKQVPAEQYCFDRQELAICASLLAAPNIFEHLFRNRVQYVLVRDAAFPYNFLYHPCRLPSSDHYIPVTATTISPVRINISHLLKRTAF